MTQDELFEPLNLDEICAVVRVERPTIIALIEYNVIEPKGRNENDWRFDALCLQRTRRAMSFQKDLHINLSGIALALDLLDEIDELRLRLKQLENLSDY